MNVVRIAKRNQPVVKTLTPTAAPSSLTTEFCKLYLSTLLQDAAYILQGHYSFTDVLLDSIRVKNRIDKEGLSFATKTLPSLFSEFLKYLESGKASFVHFKKKKKCDYPLPVFLNRLMVLAYSSDDHGIKTKAFDILYSFTTAFKKLNGPYPTDVLRKQFTDFVEVDEMLDTIDWFEESVCSIMESARQVIYRVVKHWSLSDDNVKPRPGPGAVNTSRKKHERYRAHVLYQQIDDVLNYQEWWYATPWHACLDSRRFIDLHNNKILEPTARAKYVPKQVGKARGICIEENEMQVMQQAIRVSLSDLIERKLGNHIALTNQSINASAALAGSKDKYLATIDESEASDRIARELVAWLFQDNEELYNVLMALSTKWVKPPKELAEFFPDLIRTKKYAPMGSALCFPIMSLVHYALLIAIIEHSTVTKALQREYSKQVLVYGDDIVVPSAVVPDVYYWLPKFGIKINTEKSFYKCHFRESCGVHAYHGVDVTPVFIKYTPYHRTEKALASSLENEKTLFTKGFHLTSALLRRSIKDLNQNIGFCPEGLALSGFSRTFSEQALKRFKINARRKWNRDLQAWTYVVSRFTQPIKKENIPSDEEAYLRWLWVHAENAGPIGQNFQQSSVGDSFMTLKIVKRRVQESALHVQNLGPLVDRSLREFPYLSQKPWRKDRKPRVITERESLSLQQAGAAPCCVYV